MTNGAKQHMLKTKNVVHLKRATYILLAAISVLAYFPTVVSASQVTNRKVTMGSSVAGINTTYQFIFTAAQSTAIKSASFTACTTASGTCTPVVGFADLNTSTLTAQPTNLGSASGWTVDVSTVGSLRLKNTSNSTAPTGSQTVGFSNVKNPTATNSTFFIRIATFSDDTYTTAIDTGTVAASTAGQITVMASVDEALTFTLANTAVDLGKLSISSTGAGTSAMTVATNASTGYSVNYSGSTLTSGLNTIPALSSPTASVQNSKQFGINLVSNTTPAVGSNVSGTGSGTVATGYNTANQFKFIPAGEVIASASVPTNSNVFTTSYIANIDGVTAAGAYSTVVTYVATANF